MLKHLYCILFVLTCLAPAVSPALGKDRAITLTFAPWPPMGYTGETGRCRGLFPDISRAVFEEELGIRLDCRERPWKRAQLEVEFGHSDVMLTVPTASRRVYSLVSQDPFYSLPLYIYTYAGHEKLPDINHITSARDIKRLNLLPVTNLGNGWHRDNVDIHGIPTYYVGDEETTLHFLASRRADIMIDGVTATNYLIRKHGLSQKITLTESRFSQVDLHLLLSKKSRFAGWMPRIDEAFRRATAKGRIREIVSRYEHPAP